MSTVQNVTIYFPGKLVIGKGALDKLADEILELACAKVLIVTIDPLFSKIHGLISNLEINHVSVHVDTGIIQEPSFEDFKNLMNRVESFDPDVVVGIGGGSVLDIAKLVAAQLGNEQILEDIVGIGLLKGRRKN